MSWWVCLNGGLRRGDWGGRWNFISGDYMVVNRSVNGLSLSYTSHVLLITLLTCMWLTMFWGSNGEERMW
jgi:hypothetical protein